MPATSSDRPGLDHRELALLAHEVRGALTVISGYSELLRRLDARDREAALGGIQHAVERIDALLTSALEGTFGSEEPREPVDLAALAEMVAEEQRAISGRRVEVTAASRPYIMGTPEALERALGNLIGNSLKYSLMSSAVEVFVDQEDGTAVLSVADRGPGIPAEERERVLQPFARLDMHAAVPGSGLGLTVVSGVTERHGGRVEILDRPGGGAIVRLELPTARSEELSRASGAAG